MVYKVRVTDKANTDLDEIIRYIAEKLSNATCSRFFFRLLKIQAFEEFFLPKKICCKC
ncbi:type II toxin-antitoxin system RelE/ParE family toxin [Treponema medium]|uniref:Type II toxin-antitoxin system RelE/ParE family toxin n=1 Tax=Treponema medium TaxID=58231 RepID=A0ABX7LW49_TREMD|nr:hypothetical protein [Treponema medium]QSH92062.1 type II toxin-antitoxin system RelE/ParE family toxin [Treponema medium]QSH97197.1 type II toxin-antitoxin system RelE/ParE family toxin [Treponema medium]